LTFATAGPRAGNVKIIAFTPALSTRGISACRLLAFCIFAPERRPNFSARCAVGRSVGFHGVKTAAACQK
jgi:hypothetical protein